MKKLSFESNGIKVSLEYDTNVTEQDKSEVLLLIQNLLKVNEVKETPVVELTNEPEQTLEVVKKPINIPTHKINNQILFILQKAQMKCSPNLLGKPRVPVTLSDVPPKMFKPHSAKRPNKWYQRAYGSLYYQEERKRGYK